MSNGDDFQDGDYSAARPTFHLGQHDSAREEPLTDLQYGQLLNAGVREIRTLQRPTPLKPLITNPGLFRHDARDQQPLQGSRC